jgi:hypothetical protein
VGLFRRREPLHERLAREGGLVAPDPRPWPEVGIHGVHRPREADAVVTAEAPGVEGDLVRFVSLPDGTILVEEGGDASLDPLAQAVEGDLRPPYRARGVRQGDSLWAVEASRIEVLELPDAPPGDELDLAKTADGAVELRVDGERVFGSLPDLEARGEREGREYAVHAERLDGHLWEIRAAAL